MLLVLLQRKHTASEEGSTSSNAATDLLVLSMTMNTINQIVEPHLQLLLVRFIPVPMFLLLFGLLLLLLWLLLLLLLLLLIYDIQRHQLCPNRIQALK